MQADYQFMVDFTMPEMLTEEFMGLLPFQRAKVNRLFREGKLINYALSLENSKLWAVFNANSEMEVMEIIAELPLTKFMKISISMLTFYNSLTEETPAFSMN
ncbi:MAG TPA: muconolactone Delta-isomerase family protein [Saprospiraceae bacterium]|nr:muconolactone Delta-isomerase family protein [Saprospiraceae bacterium]